MLFASALLLFLVAPDCGRHKFSCREVEKLPQLLSLSGYTLQAPTPPIPYHCPFNLLLGVQSCNHSPFPTASSLSTGMVNGDCTWFGLLGTRGRWSRILGCCREWRGAWGCGTYPNCLVWNCCVLRWCGEWCSCLLSLSISYFLPWCILAHCRHSIKCCPTQQTKMSSIMHILHAPDGHLLRAPEMYKPCKCTSL